MTLFTSYVGLCLLSLSLGASGQEAKIDTVISAPNEAQGSLPPTQAVEVNGLKNPDWKPYKTMLKGLDAFEEYRSLAPNAPQVFILKPKRADVSMQGVGLKLEYDETRIAIPLAEDGTFILPRNEVAEDNKAEIVLNRKKDFYRWYPHVRTPGLAENQRRLGDMRLECEVLRAMIFDEAPFLLKIPIKVAVPSCKSKKITMFFPSQYLELKKATLVQNNRRLELTILPKESSYIVPLSDESFNDDAIVQLDYETTSSENKSLNYNTINFMIKIGTNK